MLGGTRRKESCLPVILAPGDRHGRRTSHPLLTCLKEGLVINVFYSHIDEMPIYKVEELPNRQLTWGELLAELNLPEGPSYKTSSRLRRFLEKQPDR